MKDNFFEEKEIKYLRNSESIIVSLPLKNGLFFSIVESAVEKLGEQYPSICVETELLRMKMWFRVNQNERKTAPELVEFMTGWLTNAQWRNNWRYSLVD